MSKLQELSDAIFVADDAAAMTTAVDNLCDWLQESPEYAAQVDICVVRAVRSGRYFGSLKKLSETLNGLGHPNQWVRLLLAQGLIDTGSASTAIDVLKRIRSEDGDSHIGIETSGLTGRAFKDLYQRVRKKRDDRGSELINLALQHYGDAFDKSDKTDFWSGENLLALLRRAEVEKIDIGGGWDSDVIASKIVSVIEEADELDRHYWHWATLGVVAIRSESIEEARFAFGRALTANGVDAFALGGTIRQLEEWWDLEGQGQEGVSLLAELKGNLLQIAGGNVQFTSKQARAVRELPKENFEKIFGTKSPVSRRWLLRFLEAGASVGQIMEDLGDGVGTCFVLDGGAIHHNLEGERLILTNDHVVSPHPERYTSNPPLRVSKALAKFEVYSAENGRCEIAAKEIVWSSGAQDHDACIIRLQTDLPADLVPLRTVDYVPIVDPTAEESVYIIGHPGGRSLSYSMQNAELIAHNCVLETGQTHPGFIHYETPTEPGNSGSPAFNADLDVIGLHHAGGLNMRKLDGSDETYAANEAVWIESILRAARADLEAGRDRYLP
jgi:S1-C subfamily serine protease